MVSPVRTANTLVRLPLMERTFGIDWLTLPYLPRKLHCSILLWRWGPCPGRAPFYNLLPLSLSIPLSLLLPFSDYFLSLSLFMFSHSVALTRRHYTQGGQSGPLTPTGVRKTNQTWVPWFNEDSERAVREGSNSWKVMKKFIRCNSYTVFILLHLLLHGT